MPIDMKELARLGARSRLAELDKERAVLLRAFPALRTPGSTPMVKTEADEPKTRRRRKMTPAQRKAVGERMRKYWAARRKAEGKTK